MIVLDTHYAQVTFDKVRELGMVTWKGKTTSEEYQAAFNSLLELQKKEKISRYISDIRDQAIVSPNDRKWFETVALPLAIQQGLKVAAAVFDGNAFKKYYINVIITSTNKYKLPMRVFNDMDEAIEWIMTK